MEKLPMCRICLVQNVRMFILVNRKLRDLYEKLTNIPFITEDSRPILACYICCTKLKQCYRLLRQCLDAEKLFALMKNKDYEPNPVIKKDHFESYNRFIKSPIVHVSLIQELQTERIAIKQELPAVCEELDDNIELKEGHLNDEQKLQNFDISCLDSPLIDIKTEIVEEQEIVTNKREQRAKRNCVPAAKKRKLDTRRVKVEKAITTEQKKHRLPHSDMNQNTQHLPFTSVTERKLPLTDKNHKVNLRFCEEGTRSERVRIRGKKSHKCTICQCCFSHKGHLNRHIRIHTGEKPNKCKICDRSFSQLSNLKRHIRLHTGFKPYKCDLCQRSFNDKRDLSKHILEHNGEKPLKCDFCQLGFNDRRYLIKHIRKHTGEKPFKCDVCRRSFLYPCDFKKHFRIHTGEKPYTCDVCQRSFNIKGNLKKHFCIHG